MQNASLPTPKTITAPHLKVGIAVAEFNHDITSAMLASAESELTKIGVAPDAITTYHVAGAAELPFALQKLARSKKFDCLVSLGCIIRGETPHFDYVCKMVQEGVLRVSLDESIPIGFGLITVNDHAQAVDRTNLGADAVKAAVRLALLP